jgi:hypothetical protein
MPRALVTTRAGSEFSARNFSVSAFHAGEIKFLSNGPFVGGVGRLNGFDPDEQRFRRRSMSDH